MLRNVCVWYVLHGLVVFALLAQRFYKKAAAFVLRSVAKHSPELAQAVVDSGALEALVMCLEEFDPSVKVGVGCLPLRE